MQVVKCILFTSFLVFMLKATGQKLSGQYELKSKDLSYLNFRFSESNTFKSTSGYTLDHESHFSSGYYLIQNDTLLFFYDSISDPNGISKFEITKKEDSVESILGTQKGIDSSIASLELKLIDSDLNPILNVAIAVMQGKNVLSLHETDSLGRCNIYTSGKVADRLSIFDLRFQHLEIKLENFWGYDSEVEAVLAPYTNSIYNQKYFIEKYLIKENTNSRLVLTNLKTREEVSLVKRIK